MKKVLLSLSLIVLCSADYASALTRMGGTRDRSIYGVRSKQSISSSLFGQPGVGIRNNYFKSSNRSSKGQQNNYQSPSEQKARWNHISQQYLIQKHRSKSVRDSGNTPEGFVPF